ncbi:MAG: hypothetical protein QOG95_2944, partial [Mycobacterium sp.]|nr:hypothetical protein [Mycobacterium sp.]
WVKSPLRRRPAELPYPGLFVTVLFVTVL